MAILQIDVEWFRFPAGYEFTTVKEHARRRGQPNLENNPDVNWIVPKGAERIPYRPFEKYDLLYLAFAKLKTPDDLMNFIGMYGPLTRISPAWGEDVDGVLRTARRFNELLIAKEKGPKRIAAVFTQQEIASSIRGQQREGYPPPSHYDHGDLSKLIGTTDIVADKARGIVLRVRTDALISGLWWQLAQKLSGEANIQTCRHCGTFFETGPGTGRHADATFCSNEHKIRYYSLARTKKSRRNA